MAAQIDEKENLARMLRGQLFHSFSPELVAARSRCGKAVSEFNQAGNLSRRQGAEFWKE
jgi:hypothetical protein